MKTEPTAAVRPSADFEVCREITRRHAKSFYFASHVLPREKRLDAYAVYAFCRLADNIVDEAAQSSSADAVARSIDELRGLLSKLYAGSPMVEPPLRALQFTVSERHVPKSCFDDLLTGVGMDLTRTRYTTFSELEQYCYYVASVVGLAMARIFGVTNANALAYARDLGIAMQLTNILRDVREDYDRGRIYLPADELERFGVTEGNIAAGSVTGAFVDLMKFQIARARRYYRSAASGFEALPDDGSRRCVRLMASTYAAILDEIERRGYDVFSGRAVVPFRRKLTIALLDFVPRPLMLSGLRRDPLRGANNEVRLPFLDTPHHD